VAAVEGRGDEDVVGGLVGAGGGTVVVGGAGDDGEVVAVGWEVAGLADGVTGAAGRGGGGGDEQVLAGFPLVTVTPLKVRFTLAAHAQRLQDAEPCPAMVTPMPFRVSGVVATGKPPSPTERPSVVTG
jgi:hypothetical protein